MAPKKKTKSAKSAKSARSKKDEKPIDPWEQELLGKPVNEDGWKCNVTILLNSDPSVSLYNKLLTTYCADKSSIFRNNLKIITYSDFKQSIIFDQVVDTSDPSKVAPYNMLCTQLNAIIRGENSCERTHFTRLLASFIKYKILQLKEENIARHRLVEEFKEREKCDDEERRILFEECLAEGKISRKGNKQPKSKKKTASKKLSRKSGRKTGNKKEKQKFTTTLKRGQEFLKADHNIEDVDEPENGAEMYVVLTDFLEPNLPLELINLGVPLVGVLKVEKVSFVSDSYENINDQSELIGKKMKLDENLFDTNPTQDNNSSDKNKNFWRDFFMILLNRKNYDKLENVIFYPFSVILHQGEEGSPLQASLSKQAYDTTARVQYYLSEVINDRLFYLGNLKEINVEDPKSDIDLSEYNRLLNSISQDSVGVYHIMEAILQQITKTTTASEDVEYEYLEKQSLRELNNDDNDFNVQKNSSIASRDLESSTIGRLISRLEEFHDLTSKPYSMTLGKVDEQGIVIDFEDKFEMRKYDCKDYGNPDFENNAIQLLENFWKIRLGIDNGSEDNLVYICEKADKINTSIDRSGTDSLFEHEQTEKKSPKKTISSNHIGSYKSKPSEFFQKNYVVDENVFEKLCSIPCGHKNVLIEDKKIYFCFNSLNMHHNNDEDFPSVDRSQNGEDFENDEPNHFSEFCYSELRPKILVQNLFESIGDYSCFDIITSNFDDQGLHYLRFHSLCCPSERLLSGSLRTTDVCLRDFFDFLVPEIEADQTDVSTQESSSLEASTVIDTEINNYQQNTDHWCLDEDFVDHNSLKRLSVAKPENLPNETLVEAGEQVDFVADNKTSLHGDNDNNLDAFQLGTTRFLNFTEKVRQFRFSKTFTTKIRILTDSLSQNDFVSIEPSFGDYTMYIYIGLGRKVDSTTNFHVRHQSGMVVYFEKLSAPINTNQDSGLLNTPSKPVEDLKNKTTTKNDFSNATTLNNEKLSYRFSLSWPSCMHLDFFNSNEMCPPYIKQWYSVPNNNLTDNEEVRCYTQNGEILKFMKDESIIVYYPNGRIYHRTSTSISKSNSFDTNSQNISLNEKASSLIYEYEQTFQDFTNGTLRKELSHGVVLTYTYNGDLVVDFPDGSRITSLLKSVIQQVVDDDDDDDDDDNYNDNVDTFGKYSLSNNENYSDEEEFVIISVHYLIEHEYFASVSFNRSENNMKIGLPYGLSISIDIENDCFQMNFSNKSRIKIEKNEINLFDGNSIRSSILLTNVQEYWNTFPQFERYEFFNCQVDSKCVLLVDSWGDILVDQLYFHTNCISDEFENMYYVVRDDLSGYKVYSTAFETILDNLITDKKQCVINESVNSKHKSALFIEPVKNAYDWKMEFESYNTFERSQSTRDCCRFPWLNPISSSNQNGKMLSTFDENPQLLTIGLLQWFKSKEHQSKTTNINKIIYKEIIEDNNYRAAMEIYKKGDRIFVSERSQVIDQAKTIVAETLKKAISIFKQNEKSRKINTYKQLLKHDRYCNYFNTKMGMSFSIADEIVSQAISSVWPREIGKFISWRTDRKCIQKRRYSKVDKLISSWRID